MSKLILVNVITSAGRVASDDRIICHLNFSFFIGDLPDLPRVASCAFVDRALG
jgi:hypothetical protein